jgi:hypothetical protein
MGFPWGSRGRGGVAAYLLPFFKLIRVGDVATPLVTADGQVAWMYEPTEDTYRTAADDLSITGPWVILTEGDGILTAYEPLETTYRGEAP